MEEAAEAGAEILIEKQEMMMVMRVMRNWMTTEPELTAAYILIQLSSDSPSNFEADRSSCSGEEQYLMLRPKDEAAETEESVGDTTGTGAATAAAAAADDQHIDHDRISSSFHPAMTRNRDDDDEKVLVDGCGEIEGYPLRKKRKFRSIQELYAETKP